MGEKTATEADKLFFNHELTEMRLVKEGIPMDAAHRIASIDYDWSSVSNIDYFAKKCKEIYGGDFYFGAGTSDELVESVLKNMDGVDSSLDDVIEGSLDAKLYSRIEYKGTVKVNGEVRDVSRRVYQRNDIDIEYYDETTGLTNLERMQAGKPPIGPDGNPLQLHHILQKEAGSMVEIQEITHQQYYSNLHGLIENGASFRNDPILNKQYNNFRHNYWKWRAKQFLGGN